MTRAAIYARRSRVQQGASIDRQIDESEQYAQAEGWDIAARYTDSASAFKPEVARPGFDAMMAAAQAGVFDALIVYEFSRLSRQEDDRSALAVVLDLRGAGVDVRSIIRPSTGVKLVDDLLLTIDSHTANQESRTIATRTRSGKQLGVMRGTHQGRWAPYPYDEGRRVLDPATGRSVKRYEAIPERAEIVAEMMRRYCAGDSAQQVTDWLIEEGVEPPRPGGYHRLKRRAEPTWHQSSVADLMRNPLLAGLVDYKGQPVPSCANLTDGVMQICGDSCAHDYVRCWNVPSAVDESLWLETRRVMQLRTKPGKRGNHTGKGASADTAARFLLAGMIWHEDGCGERIGMRGRDDVYRCRGRRLGTCSLPPISRRDLDEQVREVFVRQRTVDVRGTLQRERDRLMSMRTSEATLVREERAQAASELTHARGARRRAQLDYESDELPARLFAELVEEYDVRIAHLEATHERLTEHLAQIEGSVSTADVDALLDKINAIRNIVRGKLDASNVPHLQLQLRELFEGFYVSSTDGHQGQQMIVEPRLHDDSPLTRVLDMGESRQGVVIVEELEPVLRRVDLAAGIHPATHFDSL